MKDNMIDESIDKAALISAVEKFTELHDMRQFDPTQKRYRELIPSKVPGAGQQYAFEVDLDKCTGCKACVTACHNENGLDEDETWRSVGLIQGGTTENPVIQHVTSACHHCAEPACMTGCPTKAYIKEEATGIVKHLDDQCFGCQYCILKCPYDVPKYNKKRGIVHKCDMCIGRLKANEPPACAKACPTGAIRITIVNTSDVKKNYQDFVNVPDAPASNYTYPTTRYKSKHPLPTNMASADYLNLKPEHSHLPLVFMLVLTQLSVGTFLAEIILRKLIGSGLSAVLSSVHVWVALSTGLVALAASIFHLGRPHLAFRAVLGLMTSWLSREILAFGIFAQLAVMYVLCARSETIAQTLKPFLGGAAILDVMSHLVFLSGLIGVLCSVMVYRDTKRPFWDTNLTTIKFLMTMTILGFVMSLAISLACTMIQAPFLIPSVMARFGKMFCSIILVLSFIKMTIESTIFCFLKSDDQHFFKKTAVLMVRPLKNITLWRFALGTIGGILLPLFILSIDYYSPYAGIKIVISIWAAFVFLMAGEFLERYLFFRAVVPFHLTKTG